GRGLAPLAIRSAQSSQSRGGGVRRLPRGRVAVSHLCPMGDRSLPSAAQLRARQAGMRIGLIGDLAVGIDPTGSQAWSQQDDLLLGLTIGAPPDLMNRRGQAWGLASFSPHALEARGYAPFIATLRAAMRNVGGIRIDHAMGLARLWLVPEGATPAEGAYLSYPLQDLLRLLALESVRHGAIVLG